MNKLPVLLIASVVMCLSMPLAASGKTADKKVVSDTPPASSHPAAPVGSASIKPSDEGYDVMLLMDSSGSMKKTDPQNYRKAAAKLLISLLGIKDRVGVLSFGDKVKTLIPLTSDIPKHKKRLFTAVDRISSREFSTHIHSAVKMGYDELKSSERKKKILVLLSDGKLTLGDDEKDKAAVMELKNFLPILTKAGVPIYSVAFSDFSDDKLLQSLARETGGFFRFAKEDKDIHVIFTSIFEKMKSPDSVPLEGEEFTLDKDVREATLVITKKAGTTTFLVSPAKETFTPAKHAKNINWFETGVFDMITISEPRTGRWRVKLSATEGNKVFVITNMSLKSSFDKGFVEKGTDVVVDARLEKDGGMIKEKEVLDKIAFFSDVSSPAGKVSRLGLQDNGTSGDSKAGDAVYSSHFGVDSLGQYEIKITAEGKTFKREKTFHFSGVGPAETPKPPAVEPKKTEVPKSAVPKPEINKDEISWEPALVKFGLVNLALILVVLAVLIVRKILMKIRARGPRSKTGKNHEDKY